MIAKFIVGNFAFSTFVKALSFLKILFICQRESTTERKREHSWGSGRQREKRALHWARSPMQDLIPGPWDHDLSRRQTLNRQSHPGIPVKALLNIQFKWAILKNMEKSDIYTFFIFKINNTRDFIPIHYISVLRHDVEMFYCFKKKHWVTEERLAVHNMYF